MYFIILCFYLLCIISRLLRRIKCVVGRIVSSHCVHGARAFSLSTNKVFIFLQFVVHKQKIILGQYKCISKKDAFWHFVHYFSWLSTIISCSRHLITSDHWFHCSDGIMGTMVSQITSPTIVYSAVYPGADQRKKSKLRVTGLCEGNSPLANNAKNVSICWRHHGKTHTIPIAKI